MKKIIYFLGTVLFISVLLYSCEKDFNEGSDVSELEIRNIDKSNSNLMTSRLEFAKLIAFAMNDLDFRSYMKTQSINQFINMEEWHLKCNKDDIIKNNKTVIDFLMDIKLPRSIGGEINVKTLINDLLINDPLISILFPDVSTFSPQSWDITNHIPDVVVEDDDISNDDLVGYNSSGSLVIYNEKVEPKSPIFIVQTSESMYVINSETMLLRSGDSINTILPGLRDTLGNPLFRLCDSLLDTIKAELCNNSKEIDNFGLISKNKLLKIINDNPSCIIYTFNPPPPPPPPPGGPDGCDRDEKVAADYLIKFKMNNYNSAAHFDRGISEWLFDFYCLITIPINLDSDNLNPKPKDVIWQVIQYQSPQLKYKDLFEGHTNWLGVYICEDAKWIKTNEGTTNYYRLWPHDWRTNINSDMWKFQWFEADDKETKSTFTLKPSVRFKDPESKLSGSVSFFTWDYKASFDKVVSGGDTYIGYCDKANPEGYNANSSLITFVVEQEQ